LSQAKLLASLGAFLVAVICHTSAFIAAATIAGCNTPTPPPALQLMEWQIFQQTAGKLSDNHINSIFMDNTRKIWLATNNGVSIFSGVSWATIRDSLYTVSWTQTGSVITYRVNCVVQAKDRAMWFGLPGGGVVRYNPVSSTSVWRRYTQSTLGFLSDIVLSGTADVSNQSVYGEMWFTSAIGISRFIGAANETGTWHFYTHENTAAIPSDQVFASMTKLDDNTIWFGTQSGGPVSVEYGLAGLNWTQYPLPTDSRINSIGFDLQNTVWFGNQNGAASLKVQSSIWRQFTAGTQLPAVPVNAVITNQQNLRWFGTNAGLTRFNDTTWVTFTTANSPLPSDTITALAYDFNQNLWIGTPNGVAVYNASGIHY
jgi:ligand-binding sensor domain-containing protein